MAVAPESQAHDWNAPPDAASVLSRVTAQLSALEKRDSELWVIVVLTSTLIAAGLLVAIAPGIFTQSGDLHFEVRVPKEMFFGLVALIALVNVYLASQRITLRRTRQAVISSSIQGELTRLQSFTDPLTEIYNRRSLDEMARRYMSHARRSGTPLTFMMVDVDRFKEINTKFGHLTGDMILAQVASLLRDSVRGSDAVIRYGGDEFLIVLAESDTEGAQRVIDRIHGFLSNWNQAKHLKDFELSLSIGLSQWQEQHTLAETLDLADAAMYKNKHGAQQQPAREVSVRA
jgi:diguanylate cyclase (GGDEF)-like protein